VPEFGHDHVHDLLGGNVMAETRDKVKEGIDSAAQGAKRATDRVADAAQSAQGSAQQGTMGQIVDSARSAVESASSSVTDYAGQARDKVREWSEDANLGRTAQRVQDWAEDAYGVSGEKLGEFGREVTLMIRRYPLPALAVGFGLGLMLGRMTRT
jgi:hypothetical protein